MVSFVAVMCNNTVLLLFKGSGKTYTIGGGDITTLTEDEYGIIPRALTHMFKIMEVCFLL